MSKITLTETHERRFSIEVPILKFTDTVKTTSLHNNTYNITLSPHDDSLHIYLKWMQLGFGSPFGLSGYQSMLIVPHKRWIEPLGGTTTNGVNFEALVAVDKLICGDKYSFDIVLSSKKGADPRTEETMLRNEETMLALLKDVHSVDLCFVFESDKTYPSLELWAHRVILSRYKTLADMIRKATEAMVEEIGNVKSLISSGVSVPHSTDSLVISIPNFSLAALCVLLRYIYTGEINLSVDKNLHAIGKFIRPMPFSSASKSRNKELVLWQTNVSGTEKTPSSDLSTVTWEQILMAADFFGVTDLRDRCEDEVISTMNKSNVIGTLFSVGCCFDRVKESALDYIVKNMGSLVLDGNDPFKSYKFHPECHDLMVEVMRLSAKKA